MKRRYKLPELLAPAGSYDALVAAIAAGADAVYLGGKSFGARAFAKNFTDDELRLAVKLAHVFGVRVYVTVNTLTRDKETDEAVRYAEGLRDIGVDAIIVADLGLARLIAERVPEIELHASTQMGAHNTAGVNFAAAIGCKRVVLARECSSKDISDIVLRSDAECEVFVHGALCVCHSGQCLFSSMVGGRSGNRGECAQPCRLPYNDGKYLLSLKDLSLAEHIRELIDSGVSSLKIEGRMKSPEYVYEVTRIYRALLDEGRAASREEKRRLADVFSRGGFTDGYFVSRKFINMMGIRGEEDKARSGLTDVGKIECPKKSISAESSFKAGKRASFTVFSEAYSRWGIEENRSAKLKASAFGLIPMDAETSPLTEAGVTERLSKMGATPFSLSQCDIKSEIDEGLNLPPSAINDMRRRAADALLSEYARPLDVILGGSAEATVSKLPRYAINASKGDDLIGEGRLTTAIFFSERQLYDTAVKLGDGTKKIDIIFTPLEKYLSFGSAARELSKGVYIPPVIMESEWSGMRNRIYSAAECGAKFALIGNISHLALLDGTGIIPVGDERLNITNKYSYELWRELGVPRSVVSPELTLPAARDIGGGVHTLGRVPLMITERCFISDVLGCNRALSDAETGAKLTDKKGAHLVDRKGAKFPMVCEAGHRTLIFNSAVTYMGDKRDELGACRISHEHFVFSSESGSECAALISAYFRGEPLGAPHRRIGRR